MQERSNLDNHPSTHQQYLRHLKNTDRQKASHVSHNNQSMNIIHNYSNDVKGQIKYYANNVSQQLAADPSVYLQGSKKKESSKNTKTHSMVSTSGTGSQAQLKIMSNSFYHGSGQASNQKTLNVNQAERQTVH